MAGRRKWIASSSAAQNSWLRPAGTPRSQLEHVVVAADDGPFEGSHIPIVGVVRLDAPSKQPLHGLDIAEA